MNVRSLDEGHRKRKPDLLPYTTVEDPRFQFLQDFLRFLEEWRQSVSERPGSFTQSERQKMFLTHQTYKGLVMTVKSFTEVARFLLENGVSFLLSNKFCQDPLEEHFGRTSDNPNLHQFGYNEKQLRMQRNLALMIQPKGNVRGAHVERQQPAITVSPLKKKPRN